jgi:hypothetical protein
MKPWKCKQQTRKSRQGEGDRKLGLKRTESWANILTAHKSNGASFAGASLMAGVKTQLITVLGNEI